MTTGRINQIAIVAPIRHRRPTDKSPGKHLSRLEIRQFLNRGERCPSLSCRSSSQCRPRPRTFVTTRSTTLPALPFTTLHLVSEEGIQEVGRFKNFLPDQRRSFDPSLLKHDHIRSITLPHGVFRHKRWDDTRHVPVHKRPRGFARGTRDFSTRTAEKHREGGDDTNEIRPNNQEVSMYSN